MTRNVQQRRRQQHERLADSLEILRKVLVDGIYRSDRIPRRDFERLARSGYLREILKGWYHVTNPAAPGLQNQGYLGASPPTWTEWTRSREQTRITHSQ